MDYLPTRHFSRRGLLKTALAASAAAMPISRLRTASALTGPATPVPGSDPEVRFAELNQLVVARMATLKIPGVAIGVIADGTEHVAGFGVTNVAMPTTSQRVWRAIQDAKGRATQETPVDTHSPGAGLGSIDPNNPQGEVQ